MYSYSIHGGGVYLTFDGKPSAEIRGILKANGYRWNPAAKQWWKRGIAGAGDFLTALDKRLAPKREDGKPAQPDGACWDCQDPNGYFRPFAATTPVYCDECHKAHEQQRGAQTSKYRAYDDPMGVDTLYEDQCRDQCGL